MRAVDRVVGRFKIIQRWEPVPTKAGLNGLQVVVAHGPKRMPEWSVSSPIMGTGVALDARVASVAAVAEAIERYVSLAPPEQDELVRASHSDLGDRALHPSSHSLLSPAQYHRHPKLEPLTTEKSTDWCGGFSLSRGEPVLIPSGLVHLASSVAWPNNFLPELTTTGFACHVSLPAAVLAGVCEVLERDAISIAWYNRLPMRPVDVTGTPISDLLAGPLATASAHFSLYVVPTDAPFPVLIALALTPGLDHGVAFGAACRADRIQAAEKALLEACQILFRISDRRPEKPPRVRTFDDHALFYGNRQGARLLQEVLGREEPIMLADEASWPEEGRDGTAPLEAAVAALGDVGREVIAVELTSSDVIDTGFHVVRVMIPGSVDISADARWPRFGGTRIRELPVQLGLRLHPVREVDLNRLPVPLA